MLEFKNPNLKIFHENITQLRLYELPPHLDLPGAAGDLGMSVCDYNQNSVHVCVFC